MLLFFIIFLSILLNHIWLVNNETFILAILLIMFFLLIYIFLSFFIKIYFFSNISNILNLLKYSNVINIYLDKIIFYNITIKNNFLKILLKNKGKLIKILNFLNNRINNFLLFNILNFFLILKKNLFKILNNKKLLIFKNNIKKCEIIS
jgi:hypothetical protein